MIEMRYIYQLLSMGGMAMVRKIFFVFAAFSGFCGIASADSVTPLESQNHSAWVAEPGEDSLPPAISAERKFNEPYSAATPFLEPAENMPHYNPSACSRSKQEEVVYLTQ
ncbi:MAG: hypothetical protein ACKVP5_23945 [Aestuariivirga sp.]